VVSALPASAHTLRRTEIFLSSAGDGKAVSLLSAGSSDAGGNSIGLDYALFANELVAYLTKEVLPDSANEFDGSLLGSHLSRSLPELHSDFGSHCLKIVTQIGSALPFSTGPSSVAIDSPSALQYAARAATAGLALRQVWSAFQNDVEGNRSGVSLNPKVSARRVGVSLTFHW